MAREHRGVLRPEIHGPGLPELEPVRQSQDRTLADLAAISGVGPTKLQRYGEAFLSVIREYV